MERWVDGGYEGPNPCKILVNAVNDRRVLVRSCVGARCWGPVYDDRALPYRTVPCLGVNNRMNAVGASGKAFIRQGIHAGITPETRYGTVRECTAIGENDLRRGVPKTCKILFVNAVDD